MPFAALPTLLLLPAAEAKELVIAMLLYGQGEPPEITSPTVAGIWPTFKRQISEDDETYVSKCYNAEYSGYCSAQTAAQKPKMSKEEWQRLNPLNYQTLDERIAAQTAPPEPPRVAQNEAEPEESQDTADILSAALARWIDYRGYTPEQATLERPRFEALRREHGAAVVAKAVDRAISTNSKTITIEEETT